LIFIGLSLNNSDFFAPLHQARTPVTSNNFFVEQG